MITAMGRQPLLSVLLLGLCLTASPAPARAEAMILPFVKGPGAQECLRYITVYHQPSDRYQLYVSWLQGYASRIGLEEAIKKGRIVDYLNGSSTDQMAAWLDRWCERNPFKSFYLAAVAFIKQAGGKVPVPTRDAPGAQGGNLPTGTQGRPDTRR